MTQHLIQAYRQAPWRVQLQRLGMILPLLVAIGIIAYIYITISAKAATAGLEFQILEQKREDVQRENADLTARLAFLTSENQMQTRAKALGYVPLATDKAVYVVVQDYTARQLASFAPPPGPDMIAEPIIKPSYTESLWELLFQGVLSWTHQEVAQP